MASRKTIDCWLRFRAGWTAEVKPAPLEEPLDFRTKALGRAIYRQLKRLVTVLLLLVIKPHQLPIDIHTLWIREFKLEKNSSLTSGARCTMQGKPQEKENIV